jgi:uncharacterized membrane protein
MFMHSRQLPNRFGQRRFYGPAILIALVITAAIILSACGGQTSSNPAGTVGSGSTSAPALQAATSNPPAATAPAAPSTQANDASKPASVSFSKDIMPILQSRCVNCHGGQRTEKILNMTSYSDLMAGSENGPVVVPGDVNNSPLVQLVLQGKMPKRGPKLLPDQVQLLTTWVEEGAPNN